MKSERDQPSADKPRDASKPLLEQLADRIEAASKAYLAYDAHESISAAGIELDDFCEEHAPELTALLRARSAGTRTAVDVLRELVRLKDIKDVLDDNDAGVKSLRADVWASMADDYKQNKPLAWKRAREVLAGTPQSATEPTFEQLRAAHARMRKALDDIYNHNEATRAAVIQYYGLWHDRPENATDATTDRNVDHG